MTGQARVFVSYAHTDTKWLKEFDPHLKGLELHAAVARFDDRKLLGGEAWDERIKAELEQADLVLLLVTANFIGSDYIHRVELPAALKLRAEQGCVVLPVLVDGCYRKPLGIDDINYLPKDDAGALKPVASWAKGRRAGVWAEVAEHIHRQLERRLATRARDDAATRATGIDLPRYRQRAAMKWAALDLFSLAAPGAADADTPVRLAEVFVPPQARRSRPAVALPKDWLKEQGVEAETEEALAQRAEAWERLAPEPALGLVAAPEQRLLVLLGDPGAGKSALARYVLLQVLTEASAEGAPLAGLHKHMPFLVELRDFVAREAERRCEGLTGFLGHCGAALGFGFTAEAVERQFATAPSLLIVDGLDEIFDPERRRLMGDEIVGLAARFAKLRVLVTSRIAGFDEAKLRAAGFAVATLLDLSPDLVERFAGAWFPLVFPGDAAQAARARDDLLETVQRRPQLGAIAGNPMILTIMATVARHRRLGRSRSELYRQTLDLLCHAWDYRRGLKLPPDSPLKDLQVEDTLLMLRRVAWRMQDSAGGLRANAISERDLRALLEAFFGKEWQFSPPQARRAAAEMLVRLQERNWVLTLRGPGLFGFMHRTFLEYLCATEIAERFRAQEIDAAGLIAAHVGPHVGDDAWQEVIRLLCGALPPAAAELVVVACVPDSAGKDIGGRALALAWQCLAEIEPKAIQGLPGACGRLMEGIDAWLLKGDFSFGGATYLITEAAAAIGHVTWPLPHPPGTGWPSCSASMAYEHAQIVATFSRSIWNCAEAARGYLRARAVEDPDGTVRIAAIYALGGHFRDDPQTGSLLRARAVEDPDGTVRHAAIYALAGHFRDDPQTGSLLRARAVEDPDGNTRGSAIQALAVHFRDDPQTVSLLRARAVEDPEVMVRGEAFLRFARTLEVPNAAVLASRDLNGLGPGRDPLAPVTQADLRKAAAKLGISREEVRALYDRIAEHIKLRFEDPPAG